MRNWLFHPLLFYPLAAILAVLVIAISIQPQKWPRAPGPVSGQVTEGVLVLERDAFNSPHGAAGQDFTVVRNFWGAPQTLKIAVRPGQPAPTPAEQGVRIELTPAAAEIIGERPVRVEVNFNPLPVNPADALAVSLQGIAPAEWVIQPIEPQTGVATFELPASMAVNAIGLRAITRGEDQSYGVEITRIRVAPQTP
jgi:hypothetical protein